MTTKPPGSAELDEFVAELVAFAHACGSPHYRDLAKTSEQIVARFRTRIPALRPLSLTSISDTLNRRRKGPPAWGWVATFVLACLQHAQIAGIRTTAPAPDDLAGWYARYRTLRAGSAVTPPEVSSAAPFGRDPGPPVGERQGPAGGDQASPSVFDAVTGAPGERRRAQRVERESQRLREQSEGAAGGQDGAGSGGSAEQPPDSARAGEQGAAHGSAGVDSALSARLRVLERGLHEAVGLEQEARSHELPGLGGCGQGVGGRDGRPALGDVVQGPVVCWSHLLPRGRR